MTNQRRPATAFPLGHVAGLDLDRPPSAVSLRAAMRRGLSAAGLAAGGVHLPSIAL